MKRIIGILIIAFAFLILIALEYFANGLKETLITWGVALLLTALIILGVWLMGE